MAKLVGRLKKPEPNKKKIAIMIAVIVIVCLSASGGLYYMLKDKGPAEDEFGRRRFRHDANLPDTSKQSPKEIIDYTRSAAYKNLTSQQRMHYMMENGRQVMEYQMDTYFATPKEQRTAYLDQMIDQMQAMRKEMEQMRSQMPDRPRDVNDPNREARRQQRAARMADPSNARSRAERGTALQRAQREQFMQAMQARMKQRGISMPGPGGRR